MDHYMGGLGSYAAELLNCRCVWQISSTSQAVIKHGVSPWQTHAAAMAATQLSCLSTGVVQ